MTRKLLFFVMTLFLSPLSFAAEVHPPFAPEIQKQLDAMQAKRPALKIFLIEMFRRKLELNVIQAMQRNGAPAEQIQRVLAGTPYKHFSDKVLSQPIIGKAIDRLLDDSLSPAKLNQAFLTEQSAESHSRREALEQMIQQLARDAYGARTGRTELIDPNSWEGLWGRFKAYLFD